MTEVGRNPHAPFCAFGDDSAYRDVLVYAYAVFHRRNVAKAEKIVTDLKTKFRIPEDCYLHCRVLFSGQQRRKQKLDHLSIRQVKRLISLVIGEMNKVPCLLRYAYCKYHESGKIFLDVIDKESRQVRDEPKGILGLLSQNCFTPVRNQPHVPGPEQCEIYASVDKTKIKFIGKGRQRADKYSSGMSFVKGPNNQKVKLKPHIEDHRLQEIADVYAYICSHALSSKCKDDFFKKQLKRVKFFTEAIFYPDSKFEEIGLSKTPKT